jgi:SAM-dependent methyltransferase
MEDAAESENQALAPFVDHIVGMDVSEEMIKQFNINAQETGFADRMHGYHGDLLAEPAPDNLSGPEFFDFDLAAVSMALHHFDKPDLALKRLGERLKKDGMFLIIDLVPEAEHSTNGLHKAFPQASATVRTHGFTLENMRKLFKDAGMGQKFDYQVIQEPIVFKKEGKEFKKTIFIARAQRN